MTSIFKEIYNKKRERFAGHDYNRADETRSFNIFEVPTFSIIKYFARVSEPTMKIASDLLVFDDGRVLSFNELADGGYCSGWQCEGDSDYRVPCIPPKKE